VLSWKNERRLYKEGVRIICGVDEAGRGPLAGPVVAAAVVLPVTPPLPRDCYNLNDSKKLLPDVREELFDVIQSVALAYGIGIVSHEEIDRINILQATMRAMTIAVREVEKKLAPEMLFVDGNYSRTELPYRYECIIDGDAISPSIAAASILAKVTRDRIMREFDTVYPHYGFARHKGYATREHRKMIDEFGFSPIHRITFGVDDPNQLDIFEEEVLNEQPDLREPVLATAT
jgi:ribonuclease HII